VKPFPHPPKREEKEIARTHPEPDHPPTESDLHLPPFSALFFSLSSSLSPSLFSCPLPNPSFPTGNPTEKNKPKNENKKKKKEKKRKEKKKKKTRTKKKATIEPNERRPDPFLIRTTFPSFWTPHHLLRSVSLTNARWVLFISETPRACSVQVVFLD
jgi:hypothetical protein